MFELFKFSLFFTSCILFPGWLLLRATRIKFDLVELSVLSYSLGTVALIFSALILRMTGLPIWLIYFIGLVSIVKIWILVKKDFRFSLPHSWRFWVVAVICWSLVSVSMVSFHLGSRIDQDFGFLISAGRDNFWRLSIMQELTNHFPPQIPGYAGTLLKNYHLLYDLLIATTHQLTEVSIPILHFQFFSLVMAYSFCVMSYVGAKMLVRSKWVALLMSVLIIGTGNLSYLLRFLSSRYTFLAKSNIFLADSPFDQSHNPFNMLAYTLFLSIPILFAKWVKSQNNRLLIYISISVAVLFGVKIYAGILALGATIFVYLYLLIKKKGTWWFLFPIVTLFPVIQMMRGNSFAMLTWNPGWVLMKMIEDKDRLFSENTVLKLQHYQQTQNVFRILETYVKLLCVYIVGNLNIRLLGFLIPLHRKWIKQVSKEVRLWILSAIFAAFLIPLLFSQNRAPYDSIQFMPYGLILMSLVSGVVIERVLMRIRSLMGKLLVVIMLLLVALPTNIVVAWDHLVSPKEVISKTEVDALTYLYYKRDTDDIVLTDLDEEKMYLMYVPAISGKRVFLSGISLTEQLGIDTKNRWAETDIFFQNYSGATASELDQKKQFLTQSNIKYIYLSKTGLQYIPLMKSMKMKLEYQNEAAVVYSVE